MWMRRWVEGSRRKAGVLRGGEGCGGVTIYIRAVISILWQAGTLSFE